MARFGPGPGRGFDAARHEDTARDPRRDGPRSLNESIVTFEIGRAKGGSRLTVEYAGFPLDLRWVEVYAGTQADWACFPVNLKSVLEHKRDPRSRKDCRAGFQDRPNGELSLINTAF